MPNGFPFALAGALAVVLLVEVGFRITPPEYLIPYDLGQRQYDAFRVCVDEYGPGDICILGSSRTRESFVAPLMAECLSTHYGTTTTVRNFGAGNERAHVAATMLDYFLRKGQPKLVVLGITPRIIHGPCAPSEQLAMFWNWSDWWKIFRERPSGAIKYFSVVALTSAGDRLAILKYRHRLTTLAYDAQRAIALRHTAKMSITDVLRGVPSPCPARGELTRWQRFQPGRSLITRPVPDARVKAYADSLLERGEYPLSDDQVTRLADAVVATRRAEVPVVFVELPMSSQLLKFLPENILNRTREKIGTLAVDLHVPFLKLSDLSLSFGPEDFLEQSHLNHHGATLMTNALCHWIISSDLVAGDSRK